MIVLISGMPMAFIGVNESVDLPAAELRLEQPSFKNVEPPCGVGDRIIAQDGRDVDVWHGEVDALL